MPIPRESTKHARIFAQLHAAIADGTYAVGTRIPSEERLAVKFGATRVTVAKALLELVRLGLLERRPGSGSYVRQPQRASGPTFALLVPNLGQGEIFEPICGAIAAATSAGQGAVLWGQFPAAGGSDRSAQAERLCESFVERRVDGVFFAPIEMAAGMERTNRRIAARLQQAGIPVVLLDRDIEPYPRRSAHDLVGVDNRRIGHVLADHLLEQGCKRLHVVQQSGSAPTVAARIAGVRDALALRGLALAAAAVHAGDAADPGLVRPLLARGAADGVICGNDSTAAQVMRHLAALGRRVPQDIRVVGVDDLNYAKLLAVPLTTVRQPCTAIGVAAHATMLSRIAHPELPARDVAVDFTLVVRQSSTSPSA